MKNKEMVIFLMSISTCAFSAQSYNPDIAVSTNVSSSRDYVSRDEASLELKAQLTPKAACSGDFTWSSSASSDADFPTKTGTGDSSDSKTLTLDTSKPIKEQDITVTVVWTPSDPSRAKENTATKKIHVKGDPEVSGTVSPEVVYPLPGTNVSVRDVVNKGGGIGRGYWDLTFDAKGASSAIAVVNVDATVRLWSPDGQGSTSTTQTIARVNLNMTNKSEKSYKDVTCSYQGIAGGITPGRWIVTATVKEELQKGSTPAGRIVDSIVTDNDKKDTRGEKAGESHFVVVQ